MSTDTMELEFPPIDHAMATAKAPTELTVKAPAGSVANKAATIKEAAIAVIRAHEPHIIELAERYRDVALDLSTPKGFDAGKATRTEVRENGRLMLQRERDKAKDLLNDAKSNVVEEADRLIAIIKPVEDHLQAQIDARQKVIDDEKAAKKEAERIEAERIAAHEANLARFAGYVESARGKTAAEMLRAIDALIALPIDPETWQEFTTRAVDAKGATLAAFRQMHAEAAQAEADAAELAKLRAEKAERERIERENAERIAREQEAARIADEQRRQDAERRKATAYQAAMDRVGVDKPYPVYLRFALDHGNKVPLDKVDEYIAALNALQAPERSTPAQAAVEISSDAKAVDAEPITHQDAQESGSSPADAPAPCASNEPAAPGSPSGDEEPAARAEVAPPAPIPVVKESLTVAPRADEPATLNLGTICGRLDPNGGVRLTRAFIHEVLNVKWMREERGIGYYSETQFRCIVAKLVAHIAGVA